MRRGKEHSGFVSFADIVAEAGGPEMYMKRCALVGDFNATCQGLRDFLANKAGSYFSLDDYNQTVRIIKQIHADVYGIANRKLNR